MQETLTFEAMPQAILELMHKVDSLRAGNLHLKSHIDEREFQRLAKFSFYTIISLCYFMAT